MTMTADEMTSRNYDLLMCQLCPWGSSDVWNMIKTAEELGVNMYDLAEILQEQAENWGINLYNDNPTTDVNALFNDYILQQARNNIDEVLHIDIIDYDVYFFANYLDCPLQYTNEIKEKLQDKIEFFNYTSNYFDKWALYLFDEMGITIKENEEE